MSKGIIHIQGRTEHDSARFHCTQNGPYLKACLLFLEFSIEYFQIMIDCCQLKPQKMKLQIKSGDEGDTLCIL